MPAVINGQILPGDVATAILGQAATPETVAAIRRDLNLDEPAVLRYLHQPVVGADGKVADAWYNVRAKGHADRVAASVLPEES